jgi:hypothetical protein
MGCVKVLRWKKQEVCADLKKTGSLQPWESKGKGRTQPRPKSRVWISPQFSGQCQKGGFYQR